MHVFAELNILAKEWNAIVYAIVVLVVKQLFFCGEDTGDGNIYSAMTEGS